MTDGLHSQHIRRRPWVRVEPPERTPGDVGGCWRCLQDGPLDHQSHTPRATPAETAARNRRWQMVGTSTLAAQACGWHHGAAAGAKQAAQAAASWSPQHDGGRNSPGHSARCLRHEPDSQCQASNHGLHRCDSAPSLAATAIPRAGSQLTPRWLPRQHRRPMLAGLATAPPPSTTTMDAVATFIGNHPSLPLAWPIAASPIDGQTAVASTLPGTHAAWLLISFRPSSSSPDTTRTRRDGARMQRRPAATRGGAPTVPAGACSGRVCTLEQRHGRPSNPCAAKTAGHAAVRGRDSTEGNGYCLRRWWPPDTKERGRGVSLCFAQRGPARESVWYFGFIIGHQLSSCSCWTLRLPPLAKSEGTGKCLPRALESIAARPSKSSPAHGLKGARNRPPGQACKATPTCSWFAWAGPRHLKHSGYDNSATRCNPPPPRCSHCGATVRRGLMTRISAWRRVGHRGRSPAMQMMSCNGWRLLGPWHPGSIADWARAQDALPTVTI